MRYRRAVISLALCTVLAACASPSPRSRLIETAERLTERLDTVAQPGQVASTDLAFARAAREDGQWTAFRAYAANDAVIHGRNGPIDAGPWLAALADPDTAVQWAPRAVWSSCDGGTAVSFGRFVDPAGMVGSYVTVWELVDKRDYRWVYDMAGRDDPQPLPKPGAEPAEGSIVVTALNAIDGKAADCPRAGGAPETMSAALPAPQQARLPLETRSETALSSDGTLQWRWEQQANGTRRFVAHFLRDGAWAQALDFTVPQQTAE